MLKSVTFCLLILLCACSDEVNDPYADLDEIIDLAQPEIIPLSIAADTIIYGVDTLDLRVLYKDNYNLGQFDLRLNVTNGSAPEINMHVENEDSTYLVDTFYVLPVLDTVKLDFFSVCTDYAENVSSLQFSFQVIP